MPEQDQAHRSTIHRTAAGQRRHGTNDQRDEECGQHGAGGQQHRGRQAFQNQAQRGLPLPWGQPEITLDHVSREDHELLPQWLVGPQRPSKIADLAFRHSGLNHQRDGVAHNAGEQEHDDDYPDQHQHGAEQAYQHDAEHFGFPWQQAREDDA